MEHYWVYWKLKGNRIAIKDLEAEGRDGVFNITDVKKSDLCLKRRRQY